MKAEQQALMERWRGFLNKIDGRLDELIAEAQQGVDMLAARSGADLAPLTNALSGLDYRIRQLRDKVSETWDSQGEPKFSAARMLDAGLDAKRDYELAFDEKWALWKARAVAGYYRSLRPDAEAALKKPVYCTNCGAQLTLPDPTQISSVPCSHCSSVNQVIPEAVVQTYYGGAPRAIGEERAEPIRHEIERYRAEVDRWRRARNWAHESIQSMERWEQLELSYWRTLAQAQAELLGQPVDEELVESRMEAFRRYSLETDQVWVRAKGRS